MDLPNLILHDIGLKECLDQLLDAPEGQIASFLTYTAIKPLKLDNMIACSKFMIEKASKISLPNGVDLVGTGGDGHSTINVSTISALIAASMGVKMAKHGNRSASSKCGSADFLEHLGYDLLKSDEEIRLNFEKYNFAFLYAPKYHSSMKKLKSIRKELGFPTIFNLMGPLTNPSLPKKAVVGVAKPEWGQLMAECLIAQNYERAMVVCGFECLDEISPCGKTHSWLVENGNFKYLILEPSLFGLAPHLLEDIKGGDASYNGNIFNTLVNNCDDIPAIRDVICINVAALLWVDRGTEFKAGIELAKAHLISANLKDFLKNILK
eukprot:NODE_126_length_17250_cov_2.558743.p6 type:complete len:323 gc:universal NODE_126_length_17250_cov_2.558743:13231-14199(+)